MWNYTYNEQNTVEICIYVGEYIYMKIFTLLLIVSGLFTSIIFLMDVKF